MTPNPALLLTTRPTPPPDGGFLRAYGWQFTEGRADFAESLRNKYAEEAHKPDEDAPTDTAAKGLSKPTAKPAEESDTKHDEPRKPKEVEHQDSDSTPAPDKPDEKPKDSPEKDAPSPQPVLVQDRPITINALNSLLLNANPAVRLTLAEQSRPTNGWAPKSSGNPVQPPSSALDGTHAGRSVSLNSWGSTASVDAASNVSVAGDDAALPRQLPRSENQNAVSAPPSGTSTDTPPRTAAESGSIGTQPPLAVSSPTATPDQAITAVDTAWPQPGRDGPKTAGSSTANPGSSIAPAGLNRGIPQVTSLQTTLDGAGGGPSAQADSPETQVFAAQAARGLSAALNQKTGEVTLRLQPAQLGQLRIKVSLDQQAVTARFEVSTPKARELLDKSLAGLRSSLESKGLSLERVHVHLAPPADESAHNPARDAAHHQDPSTGPRENAPNADSGSGDPRGTPFDHHSGPPAHREGGHTHRSVGDAAEEVPIVLRGLAEPGVGITTLGLDTIA